MKKNKIDKDQFEKKIIKKEKNHIGKYCSNPQCFKRKTTQLNFQPVQYLKKLAKIILKKKLVRKHYSKTKTMWGNTVAIHSVLKEKTTKLNCQSVQY